MQINKINHKFGKQQQQQQLLSSRSRAEPAADHPPSVRISSFLLPGFAFTISHLGGEQAEKTLQRPTISLSPSPPDQYPAIGDLPLLLLVFIASWIFMHDVPKGSFFLETRALLGSGNEGGSLIEKGAHKRQALLSCKGRQSLSACFAFFATVPNALSTSWNGVCSGKLCDDKPPPP